MFDPTTDTLDSLDFADPCDPIDALSVLDRAIDTAIAAGETREAFITRKSASPWPAETARRRRDLERATAGCWPVARYVPWQPTADDLRHAGPMIPEHFSEEHLRVIGGAQ